LVAEEGGVSSEAGVGRGWNWRTMFSGFGSGSQLLDSFTKEPEYCHMHPL